MKSLDDRRCISISGVINVAKARYDIYTNLDKLEGPSVRYQTCRCRRTSKAIIMVLIILVQ